MTHSFMRRGAVFAVGAMAMAAVSAARAAVVVHWALDETAGQTAADVASAGGTQNGTSAAAAPQWQPAGGILGGALRFSPTAQADTDENLTFTAASSIIPSYPLTIASWVRTSSSTAVRETFVFLGNQAAGDQYFQTSKDPNNLTPPSRAVAGARNTTFVPAAGGPAVNDNAWHHVVGVYNSATSRTLYVDGQQVATNATSVTFPATTRLSIGALMRNTPTDSYAGLLDDVGVWDESLSPVRVALLNGLGRFSGVVLDDPSVAQVESVFTAQSGSAASGPLTWQYATGLPSNSIGSTGTIGSDPYIVLDASGNGVRGVVPEPAGVGLLAVAAAGALAARRRRRV